MATGADASPCPICGDEGVIDEADAARLGLDLGDARTAPCPACGLEHRQEPDA